LTAAHWRDVVATLTRLYGPRHLDLIEECAQDALLRALELWPYHGEPQNPTAWLIQTAKHKLIDRLRRERNVELTAAAATASPMEEMPIPDDRLAMIFLCCHPSLAPETQIALTLQAVCGLNARQIGEAFLLPEATIAQRLVRAKRQLRQQQPAFELPADLDSRLPAVLTVVYLLFNAGYTTAQRLDLCEEAIYLAELLATTGHADALALAALLALQSSRLPARAELLAQQDRSLWNQARLAQGLRYFQASLQQSLSRYHVEAAIAVEHAVAPSFEVTNWPLIVSHYDDLLRLAPSPIVELNRAIAIGFRDGPAAALALLREHATEPALASYPLLGEALRAFSRGNTQAQRRSP